VGLNFFIYKLRLVAVATSRLWVYEGGATLHSDEQGVWLRLRNTQCSVEVGSPAIPQLTAYPGLWAHFRNTEMGTWSGFPTFLHTGMEIGWIGYWFTFYSRSCLAEAEVSLWGQERCRASECLEYVFIPTSHNATQSWVSASCSPDSAKMWSPEITTPALEKGVFHAFHLQCVMKMRGKIKKPWTICHIVCFGRACW
jgi:hypothetical protein